MSSLLGAAIAIAGCRSKEVAPSVPASSSTAGSAQVPSNDTPVMNASELCSVLFGETRKQLGAACPNGGPTEALHELESSEERCVTIVGDSLEAGRAVVIRGQAERCAADIRARWLNYPAFERKRGSEGLNLDAHPACADLFRGARGEGEECKSTIDCATPLVCPHAEARNFCAKPAEPGQRCSGMAADQLTVRSGCVGSNFCGRLPTPVSPAAAIHDVIGAASERMRACYEVRLAKNPSLAGLVSLEVQVGKDGAVSTVRSQESSLPDPLVVSCIEKVFRTLKFPPSDDVRRIPYAIRFASPATAGHGSPGSTSAAKPAERAEALARSLGASGPATLVSAGPFACRARAGRGDACASSRGCAEKLVCKGGTCVDAPADGETCRNDNDCPLASRCTDSDECVALLASAQPCERDMQCAGGVCKAGVCAGPCRD
jgi:hypothetical protein